MVVKRIFSILGAGALATTLAGGQQSSQTIRAESGEASVVIESTLNGIGGMIAASSGDEHVEVRYDPDGAAYHIRSGDGSTVRIDARTGKYTINATNPDGISATVEQSLSGVGAILRAAWRSQVDAARSVEIVLSSAQRNALNAVWLAQGLSQSQIDAYVDILGSAEEIEHYARQLERDARQIERDARLIEREARRLESEIEGEAERIERSAGSPEVAFSCGSSEDLVLRGRTIETDGIAIDASGSCDVVIDNCEITSRTVAIRVTGSADVEIINSRIEGLTAAVEIAGTGDVEAEDTEFIGGILKSGIAGFEDNGGNTFRKN
jgi:hypothetical protein